ncbi:MAG: WYL domain-containing protein [Muribaculaceae bacterium]|nr:WYL domain-containing protein [Muribaculaceae bacterium]
MAQNKNALLRYRTIDRCLRNTGRRWTLHDLVDACSDALYEYEGKQDSVSLRTVQLDIQMMRSDRLGYEAPIEVYDKKYYRYSDPDYSISNRPLSQHDIDVLNRTIDLLRRFDEFDRFHDMADVVNRLQDKVATATKRPPIVDFERNPNLKGLGYLNPLYDMIAGRRTVCINYRSFNSRKPVPYVLYPHLLKEYRNRWFVFGSRVGDMKLFNLALDRIVDIHDCPDIPYQSNPDFGEDFFDDVVGVTKHSRLKREKIVLRADASQASYILTKPIHSSQRLVENEKSSGSMTFELDVVVNWELVAVLLGFGAGIKVLAPTSLAKQLGDIYKKAASLYSE